MTKRSIVVRSYEESFEPKQVNRISALIDDLDELGESPPGYWLYTSEIQRCLYAGLLLAAVSVSSSLLELFVRDLEVARRVLTQHDGDKSMYGMVERLLEEDRLVGFSAMLNELQPLVVTPGDAAELRQFYDLTRIPVAHALVRRLTSKRPLGDRLDDLFAGSARNRGLEDRLEDAALDEVEFVVRIMKKYRPWLLRRLAS
jgi:hypothetical protein